MTPNYLMQSHTQTNLVLRDQIRFTSSEFLKSSRTKRISKRKTAWKCVFAETQGAGGANRDRTGDLLLAKQALSQLSYGPCCEGFQLVVGLGGLEPPTPRLSSVCSNQLSYRPVPRYKPDTGNRTAPRYALQSNQKLQHQDRMIEIPVS